MTVGPGDRAASVRESGQAMPGGYGASKEGPDLRAEESPEGSIPGAAPVDIPGRREGTAGDVGIPGLEPDSLRS